MPAPALALGLGVGLVAGVAIGFIMYELYANQAESPYASRQRNHRHRHRQYPTAASWTPDPARELLERPNGERTGAYATSQDISETRRGARLRGPRSTESTSIHELQELQSDAASLREEADYQAAIRASLLDVQSRSTSDFGAHSSEEEAFTGYPTPEYIAEKPEAFKSQATEPLENPFDDPRTETSEWASDLFTDSESESDKHSEKSYL